MIQVKGGVCISFSRATVAIPKSGWLKTTVMYCLAVLKARRLKSRCQQGHTPSRGLCRCRKIHSCLFQFLVAPACFGLWLHHSICQGQIFKPLSVVFPSPPFRVTYQISLCLSFIGMHVIAFSAHLDNST